MSTPPPGPPAPVAVGDGSLLPQGQSPGPPQSPGGGLTTNGGGLAGADQRFRPQRKSRFKGSFAITDSWDTRGSAFSTNVSDTDRVLLAFHMMNYAPMAFGQLCHVCQFDSNSNEQRRLSWAGAAAAATSHAAQNQLPLVNFNDWQEHELRGWQPLTPVSTQSLKLILKDEESLFQEHFASKLYELTPKGKKNIQDNLKPWPEASEQDESARKRKRERRLRPLFSFTGVTGDNAKSPVTPAKQHSTNPPPPRDDSLHTQVWVDLNDEEELTPRGEGGDDAAFDVVPSNNVTQTSSPPAEPQQPQPPPLVEPAVQQEQAQQPVVNDAPLQQSSSSHIQMIAQRLHSIENSTAQFFKSFEERFKSFEERTSEKLNELDIRTKDMQRRQIDCLTELREAKNQGM